MATITTENGEVCTTACCAGTAASGPTAFLEAVGATPHVPSSLGYEVLDEKDRQVDPTAEEDWPPRLAAVSHVCQAVLLAAVMLAVVLLGVAVFLLPAQGDEEVVKWHININPPDVPDPLPDHPPDPLPERCDSLLLPKETVCSGCPPMHNGKLCASTTRYNDMTKGSCGCGEQDPVPPSYWTLTQFTAALNCKSLDPTRPELSWCPSGCGGCFELCSTGGTTSGEPGITAADTCRIFTVTNRCGDGFGDYPEWCSNALSYEECRQNPELCRKNGSTNKYGYSAHFDLQDYHLQVSGGLGWDNAEVTFEPVPCSRWLGTAHACHGCKTHWEGSTNVTTIL